MQNNGGKITHWLTVSAVIVSALVFVFRIRTDAKIKVQEQVTTNTVNIAVLQTDIEYIKSGIEDIKNSQLTVEKLSQVLKATKLTE